MGLRTQKMDKADEGCVRRDMMNNEGSVTESQSNNLREIMEAHYYNSMFSYVSDLSILETFRRLTISDAIANTIFGFVFMHYKNKPMRLYDDMIEFLTSELPSVFLRFNVFLLIFKLLSEVSTNPSQYQMFVYCCKMFRESMLRVINLVVNVDHSENPKKLPNPNISPIKKTLLDARYSKLLPPNVLDECLKRLKQLSELPHVPEVIASYDDLRNSRLRKAIKSRMDFDRELLRRTKEEHRFSHPCDNWDKDVGTKSLNEFELAWKNVPRLSEHGYTTFPVRDIPVFKKVP